MIHLCLGNFKKFRCENCKIHSKRNTLRWWIRLHHSLQLQGLPLLKTVKKWTLLHLAAGQKTANLRNHLTKFEIFVSGPIMTSHYSIILWIFDLLCAKIWLFFFFFAAVFWPRSPAFLCAVAWTNPLWSCALNQLWCAFYAKRMNTYHLTAIRWFARHSCKSRCSFDPGLTPREFCQFRMGKSEKPILYILFIQCM